MVKPITDPSQIKVGSYYLCADEYVLQITGVNSLGFYEARCWGREGQYGPRCGTPYTMDSRPEEWICTKYTIVPIATKQQAIMYASLLGDSIRD